VTQPTMSNTSDSCPVTSLFEVEKKFDFGTYLIEGFPKSLLTVSFEFPPPF
jgi:hypothetical protein